jgi:hypothetical protein
MAVLGHHCLAGVGALIVVNVQSSLVGVQNEPAARGGVAAVEPPDEADIPCMQNGEPTSVEASWMPESDQRGGLRGLIPPSPVLDPRSFNQLRAWARRSHEAEGHGHTDRSQYHLQDGTEAAAMVELRTAPQAPQQLSSTDLAS